jgi:hypothetical protein
MLARHALFVFVLALLGFAENSSALQISHLDDSSILCDVSSAGEPKENFWITSDAESGVLVYRASSYVTAIFRNENGKVAYYELFATFPRVSASKTVLSSTSEVLGDSIFSIFGRTKTNDLVVQLDSGEGTLNVWMGDQKKAYQLNCRQALK